LIAELVREDFEPYYTSVGGGGLGILSPYGHNMGSPGPQNALTHPLKEGDDIAPESLRTTLESQDLSELAAWAEALGRWLYV
jgi:hypothetical protein